MIPFGSQRGSGQDLATHLLNAHDNERVELAEVRGSVARDLHGAFTEWELQAKGLTRCEKYLYSLSINPDPRQDPLTREQYQDYIDRTETALGLVGQPRAVVFHEKHGREHCHVVWSRIDAENGKAVQISFDKQKLMDVSREFARDHGLTLPDGYHRDADSQERGEQLSLYEKVQQDRTGLSKKDRKAEVTAAWRQSDSPTAFVQALEDRGYVLARGKRPYVLIDIYGEMNALPKLIDDKSVRTKDIRAFLEKDFPVEQLPTVEEAREQAAQRLKAREDAQKSASKTADQADEGGEAKKRAAAKEKAREEAEARRAKLRAAQAARRAPVEKASAQLRSRQAAETLKLADRHASERDALEASFQKKMDQVYRQREANAPTGLAKFLGRITGYQFLVDRLHARRDERRLRHHLREMKALKELQNAERVEQSDTHRIETLTSERRLRALDRIDGRERRSLEAKILGEERARDRSDDGRGSEGRGLAPKTKKSRGIEALFRKTAKSVTKGPKKQKGREDRGSEGRSGGGQSRAPESRAHKSDLGRNKGGGFER